MRNEHRVFDAPLPLHMKDLPVDRRGYPVPKFVEWIDGEPDFRVMSRSHLVACIRHRQCWICGGKLGAYQAFVIGPMCTVNRISSEPPSHRDCAEFAAIVCPFLSRPMARRREAGLPEHVAAPGIMLLHNPGATCVWITKGYTTKAVGDGILFEIGEPVALDFYTEGRRAAREEIDAAIERGFPTLLATAAQDGGNASADLRMRRRELVRLLDRMLAPA